MKVTLLACNINTVSSKFPGLFNRTPIPMNDVPLKSGYWS